MSINKSELRATITEVIEEEAEGSDKDKSDLIEALVDRIEQEHDIIDDESEDEADE